jgi:hypothetical protein
VVQESSARIGINVSPTQVLHVKQTSDGNNLGLLIDAFASGQTLDVSMTSSEARIRASGPLWLGAGSGLDLYLDTAGNVGVNQSEFGTAAAGVFAIRVGTAPTTAPSNAVQLWSADRGGVGGRASLHILTENTVGHVLGDLSGIGTLTPQCTLHVLALGTPGTPTLSGVTIATFQRSSSAGAAAQISIIAGNGGASTLAFGDTDSEQTGRIRYDHALDKMNFIVANATKWAIASAGELEGQGASTITTSAGTLTLLAATLALTTSANGDILIQPHGTGKVGIGTGSPAYLLDVAGAGRFTGTVTVATCTEDQHAATKAYVDAIGSGIRVKDPCRVATAAPLPANTRSSDVLTANANGSLNSAGIDGITDLEVNERVLVKNEATAANRGIYYVSALGDGSNPWTLTRDTDADTAAEVNVGCYTFIEEGTDNAGSSWVQELTVTTINSDPLAFNKFFQQAAYLAGSGIAIDGLTLSVNTAFSPDWTGAHTFRNSAGIHLAPHGTSTGNTMELRFMELAAGGSHYIGFKAPDGISANRIWKLPSADGSSGHYLRTDGALNLSFALISSTEISNSTFVTSVSGASGRISSTGGLNPTLDLAASGVSNGTYGSATQVGVFTVDSFGRITFAANTAISLAASAISSGVLGTARGGTGTGGPWSAGNLVYMSSPTLMTGLSISGTENRILTSTGSAPTWTPYAIPSSITLNSMLYASSTTQLNALASVASRVLISNGSGVPTWATDLPSGVTIGEKTPAVIVEATVAGGSGNVTVTHNLGRQAKIVDVRDGDEIVIVDWRHLSGFETVAIELLFDEATSGRTFKVGVAG